MQKYESFSISANSKAQFSKNYNYKLRQEWKINTKIS